MLESVLYSHTCTYTPQRCTACNPIFAPEHFTVIGSLFPKQKDKEASGFMRMARASSSSFFFHSSPLFLSRSRQAGDTFSPTVWHAFDVWLAGARCKASSLHPWLGFFIFSVSRVDAFSISLSLFFFVRGVWTILVTFTRKIRLFAQNRVEFLLRPEFLRRISVF